MPLLRWFNFSLDYLHYRYFGFCLFCSGEGALSKDCRRAAPLVRAEDGSVGAVASTDSRHRKSRPQDLNLLLPLHCVEK